jgi:hypothetical protein
MFLKNYTSDVPVSETIHRIEKVLIRCGVNGIMKEYGSTAGDIVAVTFRIDTAAGMPMTVRLPVDKERCLEALWLDYVDGDKLSPDGNSMSWHSRKKKQKSDFADQAARTAWKIIQDWVEVQMSMIQTKQAAFEEVFLPYLYDGRETVYQRIKERGFRALLPEKTE